MPTVRLCPQVELFGSDAGVDLRKPTEKALQHMPRGYRGELGGVQRRSVDNWVASLGACEGTVLEDTGICVAGQLAVNRW